MRMWTQIVEYCILGHSPICIVLQMVTLPNKKHGISYG